MEQIIATVLFICISYINNKRSLLRCQSKTTLTNRGWSACAHTCIAFYIMSLLTERYGFLLNKYLTLITSAEREVKDSRRSGMFQAASECPEVASELVRDIFEFFHLLIFILSGERNNYYFWLSPGFDPGSRVIRQNRKERFPTVSNKHSLQSGL